jgi:hypothetical protein
MLLKSWNAVLLILLTSHRLLPPQRALPLERFRNVPSFALRRVCFGRDRLRRLFASLISLIPHLLVSHERGW